MADLTDQQFLSQDPEVLGLQRQRQLANLLTGQAFNAPQGQMISGHYVKPSALQQALPMINAAIGGMTNANLDTKQQEMADMLRGKQSEAMQQYIKASQGTPAQMYPQQAGPMPNGGNIPQQIQTPATGPNYAEMLKAASGRYASPMLQAAGAELLKPIKTAEGETVSRLNFGPGGGTTVMAQGAEKKTEAIRGYEMAKSQGYPGSFFQYEAELKRAGAPSVINQVGASLAGQAGDLFKESKATAAVGYNAITSADKILNSTNKAITGPLANARLTGLQLADTLGVTGKGEKEKLAATREVLQETGKLALSAPPKGQGQVSNYERDLYQRAASGDINFTPTELNLIAKRAKDFGEYQIQQHKELLQAGAELGPDVGKMAKLYKVTPPQSVAPSQPAQTSNVRSLADQILQGK